MAARRTGSLIILGLFSGLIVAPAIGQTPQGPAVDGLPPGRQPEMPDDPPGIRPSTQSTGGPRATITVTRDGYASVQVNVDAMGNNISGDAANEPSIAIDPTDPNTVAIAWRQFDTIASNFRQAGRAHSTDAGQTWTFPGVLDPGQFRSDPVLSFDPNGNFYYSSLSSVTTAEVFKSTDGGVNWLAPVSAFGGDKQWMTVDRTAGIGQGNVYQFWNVQFSCCPPNDFTRSTDGGASFDGPFALPTPSMKWGTLDVGPDGTLYLVGATLDQSSHLITWSSNAQDPGQTPTFAPGTPINIDLGGTTTFGGPNPGGLLGQVWVATDHSGGPTHGNVYVLGSVNPPGSDPLDVMFLRSTDGGLNWSSPVRVNNDPIGNDAYQWFAAMSVAPTGRIDAVWNDTRNTGATNLSELYYAFSLDAGVTWSINVPISPVFNSFLGWPNQNKIGDYCHLISDGLGASLAYAATFNGEQDVYFIRIGQDCNNNGIHDGTDVATGFSLDCNDNLIPDSCESPADCNGNGIQDICDIAAGTSPDCNGNGTLDECEIDENSPAPGGPFFCTVSCDPDCNVNGIPDACELDCNGNDIPDDCDVDPLDPDGNGQTSLDCQLDGVPDECQIISAGVVYQADDGTHESTTGVPNGGSTAVINHFLVQGGFEKIVTISLVWGQLANGTPAVVYLWSDPNGDGDPTDAQVLASAATASENANTDIFTTVPIPGTFVGPVGTSFFVGVIIDHQAGEKPISFDQDNPPGQTWIAADDVSPIDPNNLGAAALFPPSLSNRTALIRAGAIGNDCNDNGVLDECEIAAEPSLDCNGNLIPDECELPGCPGILPADLDCNGSADGIDIQKFVDLLLAGGYTCQADADHSGTLDASDVPGLVDILVALP
jgi:hypothetical protein